METIRTAASTDGKTQRAKHQAALQYFRRHLSAQQVARRLLDMNFKER